ncbi:hypothetical protein Ahy_A10g049720 isoform A [Arachis hypogaea]|uniref:Glycosyl transferase 64 domain-containing protein n=1 Tax=Arachis hypogaea TaxID=3818 RepID=A0A445B7R3_ARAHY|nr:hypothetical protein Ahy_A10g049720 isoform A [Arachis hypogaea]
MMRGSWFLKRRPEQRFRLLAASAVKSARINLLLCCCIALVLIVLATTISTFVVFSDFPPSLPRSHASGKGYSIVMNTWKRYDLLKQSIAHYSSCPRLESWNLHLMFGKVLQIQWLGLYLGHIGWIHRKVVALNLDMRGGGLCGGQAAFFHKKYFSVYTNEMPASIREYVTHNRNCEDIAMSFLVANATDAPPIWVQGKIFEIGSTGISSLGGHSVRRTECVNRFTAVYGRMPLVSTSVKAVDSRNIWFW